MDALARLAVRQQREARGWSQEGLAEHAALNRSYVGEIERGAVTASLTTVAKLALAFDVPPSSLLTGDELFLRGDGNDRGGERRGERRGERQGERRGETVRA